MSVSRITRRAVALACGGPVHFYALISSAPTRVGSDGWIANRIAHIKNLFAHMRLHRRAVEIVSEGVINTQFRQCHASALRTAYLLTFRANSAM